MVLRLFMMKVSEMPTSKEIADARLYMAHFADTDEWTFTEEDREPWIRHLNTLLAAVEPQEQFTEDDALRIATAVGQVVYQECQSGGWTRAAYTIGRQIYWEIIDEKQQEQNAEVLVDAVDLKSAGG